MVSSLFGVLLIGLAAFSDFSCSVPDESLCAMGMRVFSTRCSAIILRSRQFTIRRRGARPLDTRTFGAEAALLARCVLSTRGCAVALGRPLPHVDGYAVRPSSLFLCAFLFVLSALTVIVWFVRLSFLAQFVAGRAYCLLGAVPHVVLIASASSFFNDIAVATLLRPLSARCENIYRWRATPRCTRWARRTRAR